MEVNILPLAVPAMPHSSLLRLHGARHVVSVDVLRESDVGYAGSIFSQQVHVRIQQDGVDSTPVALGESWKRVKGNQTAGLLSSLHHGAPQK